MARSERNPLRKRLAALRRRLRVVVSLRGAGWLLTLLLVSAAVAGFLDWAWRLPALVRAIVLVGTLSGAGLIAYRMLLRPLLTRVDDLTLALRIEERYPSLNDALASTVQFLEQAEHRDRREEGRPPMVVSSAMRLEAVRRALGKATGCDFNRIIDTRGLRTAGLSGIAACLAVVVLAWLYPSLAATALARLADPFGGHDWPKATLLELETPRKRIGRNEAFEVRGRLRGVIPDKALVIYRVDGGGRVEYECKVVKGSDPKTGSLAVQFSPGKMPRSFRFQVKANDAVSPWHRVEVAPPPTLAYLDGRPTPQVRLFFPRYTELEPQSLPDGTGNINAVAGTLVTLHAAANVPLRAAWIEYQAEGGPVPAAVASLGAPALPALLTATTAALSVAGPQHATLSRDRRSFFVRFVPPVKGMYVLHFEDDTGLGNNRAYTLTITPDPAPVVTLERPSAARESLSVLPGATLPLRAVVRDPVYGLRNVWLEYRLQPDGPPRKLPLFGAGHQAAAPAGGPLLGLALRVSSIPGKPQELVIDQPLPLSLVRRPDGSPLREGDVVALKVCADDHDDVTPDKQPGCSVEVEIRIISQAAVELELNRDQARIQQELTEIRQQQREAREKVTEVENRVARTQKLTPEDLAELLRVEQTQQQIRERIDTPNQESVRARVERILDTLKQNGIERSAIRERLEPVRDRLDRLGREELQQIEAKLSAVRNQGEVPEEGRKERRAETLEKDAEAAAERAKKLDELARQEGEDAAQKARLQEDAQQLRQQASRLRELARGLREETRTPPKDPQAAAQERGKELERLAEERRRMAAELEKAAARDSTGHDREKLQQARELKKSAEALRQEARASADTARANDKAEMKADLTATRRRQEEVEKTLSEMLKDLEPWSSTREVKGEARDLLEKQRKLGDDVKAMLDQLGGQPEQTPAQKARLDSAAAAQQKLAERMQELLEKMKRLAEEREKQGDSDTAKELKQALDAARPADIASSMNAAREKLGENQLGNAGEEQQKALAGLEKLVKNLEDRREAELGRLIEKLRKAEHDLEKLTEEQDQLRKKIKEAAKEKDAKKREEELKRLAGRQRELQKEAEKVSKQLSRLRAERAGQSVAQAAKQMEEAVRRLERGEAGEDKLEEALDRLDEAQEDLEAARGANEEELAREQLAKVADVLKRLKERQDRLVSETERKHKEALEAKGWTRGLKQDLRGFALAQEGLGHESKSLADRELTAAPIFARLLRKAAESMQRASEELSRHFEKIKDQEEDTSAPVAAQRMQKVAQHRLQQILDALKIDEGTPIRAANNQRPMEGSGGRRAVGDGIPPLAQLKLLRALQAEVNERTKEFARKHPDEKKLTEDEKKELEAIRREQREVAELVEEYTQKPLPKDGE